MLINVLCSMSLIISTGFSSAAQWLSDHVRSHFTILSKKCMWIEWLGVAKVRARYFRTWLVLTCITLFLTGDWTGFLKLKRQTSLFAYSVFLTRETSETGLKISYWWRNYRDPCLWLVVLNFRAQITGNQRGYTDNCIALSSVSIFFSLNLRHRSKGG